MALHHKVCHVLGGSFDLPHAETHSVMLPHAVAYNEAAARAQLQPVANLLGAQSAATGLWDLARALGAPIALKDIGMPEAGLDKAAAEVTANPYWNPRPIMPAPIRAMLADAFNGTRPLLEN
jgi:maleylacetate reductase